MTYTAFCLKKDIPVLDYLQIMLKWKQGRDTIFQRTSI